MGIHPEEIDAGPKYWRNHIWAWLTVKTKAENDRTKRQKRESMKAQMWEDKKAGRR